MPTHLKGIALRSARLLFLFLQPTIQVIARRRNNKLIKLGCRQSLQIYGIAARPARQRRELDTLILLTLFEFIRGSSVDRYRGIVRV